MYEALLRAGTTALRRDGLASAYVELPSREVALRRLRYGLEHSRGPTVLFGPPGAGKTLLAPPARAGAWRCTDPPDFSGAVRRPSF